MSKDSIEVKIENVAPGKNDLSPSLWVNIAIAHDIHNTCHMNIQGSMYSSDDIFLCHGTEVIDNEGQGLSPFRHNVSECNAVTNPDINDEQRSKIILRFPVDPKVLDYVENLRFKNTNNDVYLNFLIKVTLLEHNLRVGENNRIALISGNESLGRKKLSEMYEFIYPVKNYRISSGDWVSTFMEPLGLGKIIVFEISEPSMDEIQAFTSSVVDVERFKGRLKAAITSLYKMKSFIKKGEWIQVVEELRATQLFKSDMKKDIKALLNKTTNLPHEKCDEFTQAIDKMYSLSSQFHHYVNDGGVIPAVVVNKEDAYFVYMFMLSITQLLTRKLQILQIYETSKS